jgi:hypothetical protein
LGSLPAGRSFDPDDVDPRLPDPTRRWLRHAITPGTPLAHAAFLEMTGEIRLGRWRNFHASQLLAPGHGYVWAASTRFAGLPVTGFDRYSNGSGEMRWRMGGILPFTSEAGADISASAAGRLAAELALLPTAYDVASWRPDGPDRFVGSMFIDGRAESVTFNVDREGRLREVRLSRWGSPLGLRYSRYTFGVICLDEGTFDGITIPTAFNAGWFVGTERWSEGAFYRARIRSLVAR